MGMQVYLERKDSDPHSSQQGAAPDSSNWEEVARLLGRKQDRIEPLHALQLVPGEVTPKISQSTQHPNQHLNGL